MPGTRRKLLDVARGVSGSFCSRNADYHGAWLPGVLRGDTLGSTEDTIVVDLFGPEGTNELIETIRVTYSELLRSIMERVNLTDEVVKAACLSVEFRPREPNWSRDYWQVPRAILRDPTWWFIATVSITDDRGRTWIGTDADWCWAERRLLPAGHALPRHGRLRIHTLVRNAIAWIGHPRFHRDDAPS